MAMRQPVLLVDFAVYKPPEDLKVDYLAAQDASKQWQVRVAHIHTAPGSSSHCVAFRLIFPTIMWA